MENFLTNVMLLSQPIPMSTSYPPSKSSRKDNKPRARERESRMSPHRDRQKLKQKPNHSRLSQPVTCTAHSLISNRSKPEFVTEFRSRD
ncbi:hypothetical protein CEXT_512091 [Caerostris extrusa]|uniref:Uncharacterized protein n=1 Tax=Caerostris extrusa TaxID=172846 RepID=A0AAV4XC35_CAEEX|nr:hypothetical protein CEXT_512091 [Caerostris extrusa]